ncbi:MAG: Mevalonate kinase [Methanomassiliicoccales archaeon PtaU1.Bin124]|nr:MAG: Mevalonate kinase [Methanomassiliicoccales archaeon PtaU1.Bin124]
MKGAVTASAPGKVILLGEHAVVFGKTAISVAVGLRLHCRAEPSSFFSLNGHLLSPQTHGYIYQCVQQEWRGDPIAFQTRSEFPSGSGLGSSAAVTTSTLAVLAGMNGKGIDEERIARQAFTVESDVQGRASPIDTSTSSHGHGILIDSKPGPGLLWHIQKDTREWYIHHCPVPQLTLVVGFTGISAPTGPLVAKVKRYADKNTFAREVIEEIGMLSQEGVVCLRRNDQEGLGRLMTKDHRLLAILGVSCKELDKLVEAALPYSYGAKLTGAGGGGSMIALTDRPEIVAEEIRNKGGTPFIVRTDVAGVTLEK